MWLIKTFKTLDKQRDFIKKYSNKYQIEIIFINNGYAVEYRPLKIIKFDD